MKTNRREFLIITTTFVTGCGSAESVKGSSAGSNERVLNAGPVSKYAADGVYAAFSHQGVFLVRRNGKLSALSSICSHKKCKLKSQPDHSFYCPCHGSAFDPEGHAKSGPAKVDLPVFATVVDDRGQLLVKLPFGSNKDR